MNILILDTSSPQLTVALASGNNIYEEHTIEGKFLEVTLPKIDKLLKESELTLKDIDVIGVVVGPGSFTGIRIGITTVKAFIKVFPHIKAVSVNALDLLAYTIKAKQNLQNAVAVIPSTKTQYYVGEYHKGQVKYQLLEDISKFKNTYTSSFYDIKGAEKISITAQDLLIYIRHLLDTGSLGELKPAYMAVSQAERGAG